MRGHPRRGLWALFALACGLSFALAFARYHSVHQRTYDLAIYARMAWGFTHADLWAPIVGGVSLGVHVSVVMLPLALLGLVFGTVPVLLFAQAAAFAACVFPMHRLAERRIGTGYGFVGAAAWLLYPNLWHVTTYEFHPSNLAVLPLCWAADALDRRDPDALFRWSLVAVACREDIGLPVMLYGAAALWLWRSRAALRTLALGAFALGAGALCVTLLGGGGEGSLDQHFGAWGGSPLGIVPAAFHSPKAVIDHLLDAKTAFYVPRLLAPLLLLPLAAGPMLLPAVGTVALNLISTFPTTTHFYSHYLTPAVPALVSAAIVGLGKLPTTTRRLASGALLVATLAGHVVAGGSPLSRDFDWSAYQNDAQTEAARAVLNAIPNGASVQAPAPMLPHLSQRSDVRLAPPPETGARYVVLELSHRARVAHTETLLRMSEEPGARSWTARTDHRALVHAPPFLLLERSPFAKNAPAVRGYYREDRPQENTVALCRCLSLESARIEGDALVLDLRAHEACPADLAVRLGSSPAARRVDLLFDGVLSPAHLRDGDLLRSRHLDFNERELRALVTDGLTIGALRSSGARPAPGDPVRVHVDVIRGKKPGP